MTAESVIPYFASAISEYGIPSRMRSDHGYENFFVALLMNAVRGLGRGSHVTGRSVHNQRIERLWVDVYVQVVDYFYREFCTLEEEHLLDTDNNCHMFSLHQVYISSINNKLHTFRQAWNSHTIRTVRKTPRQRWISGMLTNMNSGHTATDEIFNVQEDLYNRIVQAFEANNLDVNVMVTDDVPPSNLTYQLPLTDHQSNEITTILSSTVEDRQKYLQIVALVANT